MNGASSEETVAHIRELVASGTARVAGADKIDDFPGSARDDLEDIEGSEKSAETDEEEDDALSSCDPATATSSQARNVANESVCSSNSLIGPVTDL